MKDDLISRKDAVRRISDLLILELKGARIPTSSEVYSAIADVPSVPAVPFEPLARFIVENLDPRVDCESCVSDVENADRDCRNCPRMSEEQVFDALTKWMEEQNETD